MLLGLKAGARFFVFVGAMLVAQVSWAAIAPTITSTTANVTEGISLVLAPVAVDNPDGNPLLYSITGGPDAAQFTIDPTSGTLSFITAPDFESPTDSGQDNVYQLVITVATQVVPPETDSELMTVTVINDTADDPAIEITENGSFFVVENTVAVAQTIAVTNEGGNPLEFSIEASGDGGKFSIESNTGKLDFTAAPDFEEPTDLDQNNLYQIVITVTDTMNTSNTDSKAFDIVVTNDTADDVIPPRITNGSVFSVAENNATVVPSLTVSNPDGFDYTFSIASFGDGALFDIDAESGKLDFKTPPDFDEPADANGDNTYIVTVTVTDSRGEESSKTFSVQVTDLPGFERPTAILSIEEPSVTFPRTGIANLRGWLVSRAEITRLELFIDGEYHADVPMGGLRQDVADSYPSYHQPELSGFSMAFPYMSLDVDPIIREGYHTILLRAHDVDGFITEAATNFITVRFKEEFVKDAASMRLDEATFVYVDIDYAEDGYPEGFFNNSGDVPEKGNGFLVQGMTLDGVDYDVVLEFQSATQQFEMIMIRPATLRSTPFGGVTYARPLQQAPEVTITTNAAQAPLIMSIEEPMEGVVSTGVSNLRGWVVSFEPVEKVELFVDGKYATDIPYGGTRPDVADEFPTYPNSEFSGFSMAYPYSELAGGEHTFMVRVTDKNGAVTEENIRFTSARFDDSFVDDKTDVVVSKIVGDIRKRGELIILDNVEVERDPFSELTVDGNAEKESYHMILKWVPATQQFEIQEISPMSDQEEEDDRDNNALGGGPQLGTSK